MWSRILVITIAVGLAACRAAPAPTAATAEAPAAAPESVLTYVPASTPYVLHFSRAWQAQFGVSASVGDAALAWAREGLASQRLDGDAMRAAKPVERMVSELARELLPFDEAARRRVGWVAGTSELVLYGHGLVPVVRVSGDSAAAYEAVRRAAGRAGVTLTEGDRSGVRYVVVPLSARGVAAVIVFHPGQLAAASRPPRSSTASRSLRATTPASSSSSTARTTTWSRCPTWNRSRPSSSASTSPPRSSAASARAPSTPSAWSGPRGARPPRPPSRPRSRPRR